METVYLAGSEEVRRASSQMASAAEQIQRAVGDFAFQIDRLERLWWEVQETITTREGN